MLHCKYKLLQSLDFCQVLGKALELITFLAASTSISKKDAFLAVGGLVDKMSDIKLKGPAGDALTAISEALGPQFVFTQLHKKAASHKNPKVCCMVMGRGCFGHFDLGLTCILLHSGAEREPAVDESHRG